jgi:hypothetical protein
MIALCGSAHLAACPDAAELINDVRKLYPGLLPERRYAAQVAGELSYPRGKLADRAADVRPL